MSLLQEIFRDSDPGLDLFSAEEIRDIEDRIIEKEIEGEKKFYIQCIIREREIQVKPEEIVRQLYTRRLIKEYQYPKDRIKFEHPVYFGREGKSADIVVLNKDKPDAEYIIVEVKKPKLFDGKEQLYSYCNATGAPIGVWLNGRQISCYNRKDPNYFEDLIDIPRASETLEDIIIQSFTLKEPIVNDKSLIEGKCYTRSEINQLLGGSIQSYLPTYKNRVVCACLDYSINKKAPLQIWSGGDPDTEDNISTISGMAKTLSEQINDIIPLFKKLGSGCWKYEGNFIVKDFTTDSNQIEKETGSPYWYMVIYLEKAES